MSDRMPSRAESIAAAGQILADTWARLSTLTAREWADEAFVPGGPSRDELVARIEALRAAAAVAA